MSSRGLRRTLRACARLQRSGVLRLPRSSPRSAIRVVVGGEEKQHGGRRSEWGNRSDTPL